MDFWYRQSNAVLAYALAALLVVCLVLLVLIWWLAARQNTSKWVAVTFAAFGLISATCGNAAFPAFFRWEGRVVPCLSNLKQAALASLMYTNDFDGRLPAQQDWQRSLHNYSKFPLRCAEVKEHQTGLGINGSLLGSRPEAEPPSLVLFADSSDVTSKSPILSNMSDVCIRHDKLPVALVDGGTKVLADTSPDVQFAKGQTLDFTQVRDERAERASRFESRYLRTLAEVGHDASLAAGAALLLSGLGIRLVVRGDEGKVWARAILLGFAVWLVVTFSTPLLIP